MTEEKLYFASDYMEGALPDILKRLEETNMEQTAGYGEDEYSAQAKEKIKKACNAPEADIYFLIGGTQTNLLAISALLSPWQGVMATETGHIAVHEAGAIEHGGHKVLTLPHKNGKIEAKDIASCIKKWEDDANRDHMVMPGMVYLSHPTEYGTLYTKKELEDISAVCREKKIPLYLDGARLAYALGSEENELTLPDIARLCDAFYIGGTKCGTLFGEALVFPKAETAPHFISFMKMKGAVLAKGRITGIQFDTLFTNDLYTKAGRHGVETANLIRKALKEKGYEQVYENNTNQIFLVLSEEKLKQLEKHITFGFWENKEEGKKIMRIATSWATKKEDAEKLINLL